MFEDPKFIPKMEVGPSPAAKRLMLRLFLKLKLWYKYSQAAGRTSSKPRRARLARKARRYQRQVDEIIRQPSLWLYVESLISVRLNDNNG